MSSSLPSASDDYKAPHKLDLSRAVWDAVFGSIGERLRALEAVKADWESLISVGTGQALAVIRENVEPHLAALTQMITQLKADVAAAQDAVAALISGGNITIGTVSGLSAALNAKAAQADLAALALVVAAKAAQADLVALTATVGAKADGADLAALAEVVGTKATAADVATALAGKAPVANYAHLDQVNEFIKQVRLTRKNLAQSGTIPWDWSVAPNAFIYLTGNATLSLPTNYVGGDTAQLLVWTTEPYTLSFASGFIFPDGIVPTITAGRSLVLSCMGFVDNVNILCVPVKF
jgi:hypothetical protein